MGISLDSDDPIGGTLTWMIGQLTGLAPADGGPWRGRHDRNWDDNSIEMSFSRKIYSLDREVGCRLRISQNELQLKGLPNMMALVYGVARSVEVQTSGKFAEFYPELNSGVLDMWQVEQILESYSSARPYGERAKIVWIGKANPLGRGAQSTDVWIDTRLYPDWAERKANEEDAMRLIREAFERRDPRSR